MRMCIACDSKLKHDFYVASKWNEWVVSLYHSSCNLYGLLAKTCCPSNELLASAMSVSPPNKSMSNIKSIVIKFFIDFSFAMYKKNSIIKINMVTKLRLLPVWFLFTINSHVNTQSQYIFFPLQRGTHKHTYTAEINDVVKDQFETKRKEKKTIYWIYLIISHIVYVAIFLFFFSSKCSIYVF